MIKETKSIQEEESPQRVQSVVPEDVEREDQLLQVPEEYLSGDPVRPLQNRDGGETYTYVLRPLTYCVLFVLVMEMLERFAFYGIQFTQTSYLTGVYNSDWNAGFQSIQAASYVQTSTAIAYSVPFVGAAIADGLLGNFLTIALFAIFVYLPGLVIIAVSANPSAFPSGEFPTTLMTVAMLGLWPLGAGAIKASVNVLGAQQFHPVLQRAQISRYYVLFYTFINVGALAGGIIVPIVCQHDVFAAYMLPVALFVVAISVFLAGSPRYVKVRPQGSDIVESAKACFAALSNCPPSLERTKQSNGGKYDDIFVEKVKVMGRLVPIMMLTCAFNIAYGQMATIFVLQGQVMDSVVFIDAAWMQNFDAVSVLIFGLLVSQVLYPTLERRNIKLHMVHKFAIGTFIGACALLAAIVIDYQLHSHFAATGQSLCIMWQVIPYMLIGAGEIFAISAAYDAAFTISPPGFKAFGSALNLFMVGAVPNFIAEGILNISSAWFNNSAGTDDIKTIELYTQAHVYKYLWVLFGIAILGAAACLIPAIARFYSDTEERSRALVVASSASVACSVSVGSTSSATSASV